MQLLVFYFWVQSDFINDQFYKLILTGACDKFLAGLNVKLPSY